MREDLSAETLDVVYDGSKMTFGALLRIFQIASEHHNKSIHTGEQSVTFRLCIRERSRKRYIYAPFSRKRLGNDQGYAGESCQDCCTC